MKSINRNVLVIRPKQAMLDWVNALEPNQRNVELDVDGHDESNVYLIKETDSVADGLKWLRKNFKGIFEEELYNWWTDESAWPPMTWENFEAFCRYRIHTVVYDTQRGGIQYED